MIIAAPLLIALHFIPPPPTRLLIDRLAAPTCTPREAATRELAALIRGDPGQARYLWYGLEHRQAEIRWRTSIVVRRLNPCGICKGIPRQRTEDYRGAPQEWACQACGATGVDFGKVPWVKRGESQ